MAPARRLTQGGRRRPPWVWLVFLALLVVPLAEIALIVAVGKVIGGWQTVALLLVESALGAYLVKREGRRTWQALRVALNTGKMPGRELADAALVLIGGTLLLTPGFLTETGRTVVDGPGRPAALYFGGPIAALHPPLTRDGG